MVDMIEHIINGTKENEKIKEVQIQVNSIKGKTIVLKAIGYTWACPLCGKTVFNELKDIHDIDEHVCDECNNTICCRCYENKKYRPDADIKRVEKYEGGAGYCKKCIIEIQEGKHPVPFLENVYRDIKKEGKT